VRCSAQHCNAAGARTCADCWRGNRGYGGVATVAPRPTQPKQENAGGPDAPGRRHAGAPAG